MCLVRSRKYSSLGHCLMLTQFGSYRGVEGQGRVSKLEKNNEVDVAKVICKYKLVFVQEGE